MSKLTLLLAAILWAPAALSAQSFKMVDPAQPAGVYAAKDYPALLTTAVFSFTTNSNHVKLYQGYVKNTNALLKRFKELEDENKTASQEYGELKRRFGWEFNGMRLHELYFSELGAEALPAAADLRLALAAQFGSFDAWKASYLALTQVRGPGWAVLAYDRAAGRFYNVWINEHDGGVPAGLQPLLIMDLFEHAYLLDFQLDRARYAQAFWAAINWTEVQKRFVK
jgi:Fe-Mn family superoxide dismutase